MLEKIEWYKEVLELEPNSRVFFPLARMLAEAGRPEEAVTVLEKGLERQPEYLEARLFLIELLFTHNKNEACNAQVRQLSRMFASYAGFWQAWAACLAQEPSEEDAASMLRFLAANFISGPLRLNDVINKGLQAIIDEKRGVQSPVAQAQADAAERLLAKDAAQHAATVIESGDLALSHDEADAISSPTADDAGGEAALLEAQSEEIMKSGAEEDTAPVADEMGSGDTALADDLQDKNVVGEKSAEPFAAHELENEEAVMVAQGGGMVAEETPQMAEEAAGEPFEEILEEEDLEIVDMEAGDALAAEIPDNSVQGALEENVASILETALEEDFTDEVPQEGEEAAASVEAGEIAPMPDSGAAELLEASEELLEGIDIPEVPDLDETGAYAVTDAASGQELTESVAFDDMIDNLADQSRELSALVQDLPESVENQTDMDTTLDVAEDAEFAEIFNETAEEEISEDFDAPGRDFLEAASDSEEKISLRTRSMAEVLAEQGDIKGALDIYHELSATATSQEEAEDIRRRMATLTANLEKPESDHKSGESEKLIGMLEALARRVEARAAN